MHHERISNYHYFISVLPDNEDEAVKLNAMQTGGLLLLLVVMTVVIRRLMSSI